MDCHLSTARLVVAMTAAAVFRWLLAGSWAESTVRQQ